MKSKYSRSGDLQHAIRGLLTKCKDRGSSSQIQSMSSAYSTEWDIHEPDNKGDQQWGPSHSSPVPGQHTSEWDGQGCSAHPDQRGGMSLSQTQKDRTHLLMVIFICFISEHFPCHALSSNQIITKEMEVNEWKRKYEESRAEVLEMRYGASLFL